MECCIISVLPCISTLGCIPQAQSIKVNAAKGVLSAHSVEQVTAWKSMLERCASQESTGRHLAIEEQMELLFASIQRRKMHINRLAGTYTYS